MRVGVVGLGKLGLATAVWLAEMGHQVCGYDVDHTIRDRVLTGGCPHDEPGVLLGLEKHYGGPLLIEKSLSDVANSRPAVYMIIVPTPSTPEEPAFSNEYVRQALANIAAVLPADAGRPILNVVSTVMPGSCEGFIECVESVLGRGSHGDTWYLTYNPEFIALGSILYDLWDPSFVLVGRDKSVAPVVDPILRELYTPQGSDPVAPLMCMPHLEAELCKLCVNVGVTFKVTFANMVGSLCRARGADSKTVLEAVGQDRRLGHHYLRPSLLGFGGPCFPRDVRAIRSICDLGQHLPQEPVNAHLLDELQQKLYGSRVAFLGVAYKPDTPVVDDSQIVALMHRLRGYADSAHHLRWWDRRVKTLGNRLPERSRGPYAAVRDADYVVIGTRDEYWYRELSMEAVHELMAPGGVIIDCWRDA